MIRILLVLALAACTAGCVTESTNSRQPATPKVQLQAHLDLARGYMEQRDWNRAKDPLERALTIDPRSAEALTLLGVLYQAQNEPDLAEEYYRQALRSKPDYAMALNNYGSYLYARGRFEEALDPLRTLVKNPDYRDRPQAYENLGFAELRVGNHERAIKAFERALSFNVIMPRSGMELAQLMYLEGDYSASRKYFDMYRERSPRNVANLCLGLRLGRVAGDENQRASYELALRNLFPDSAEAKRCIQGD
jgi:type IV pilus assembly protein PilF